MYNYEIGIGIKQKLVNINKNQKNFKRGFLR